MSNFVGVYLYGSLSIIFLYFCGVIYDNSHVMAACVVSSGLAYLAELMMANDRQVPAIFLSLLSMGVWVMGVVILFLF